MRRTLGTAVFSGMLGVTIFGIFLTPVFYYVIQWFADRRLARVKKDEEDEEPFALPEHDDVHRPAPHGFDGDGDGFRAEPGH
jgi:multidrug efflux pump